MDRIRESVKSNRILWSILSLIGLGVIFVFFQNCSPGFSAAKLEYSGASTSTTTYVGPTDLAITVGLLRNTAAGTTAGLDVDGRLMMVRDPRAGTQIFVHANGLPATASYMSHVHDQPCSVGGGAHYKVDPSITTAVGTNEFWPALVVNATDGAIFGTYNNLKHYARPEANTVVFHAADNTRLACGLMYPQGGTTQKGGAFVTLAGGVTQTKTVAGSALLVRNGFASQTVFKLAATGLAPNTLHMAHVHALPCAMTEGGAHYKQNPAVTEAVASANNEIWASFTTNATGTGVARTVINGHVAAPDAMSVVIHDPVTPTIRLACADLTTDQDIQSTTVGLDRARNVTGFANLVRQPTGITTVSLTAAGLMPNIAYQAHVHDRPCQIAAGGAHYKLDEAAPASEANEIWLRFTTDAAGSATANTSVKHLARPEAQSIVIHDPADAGRLACADLY